MKLTKFLPLLLAINGLFAQPNTTAKIETVNQNGLHKIVLTAEIRSFSKEDLSDFRIFDAQEKEVPYFIIQENQKKQISSFTEFKMISKKVIPNKSSTIIFENSKFPLDAIVLSISNSDVTKPFSISGSNDQKEWFGLINNAKLDYLEDDQSTSVFKTVTLPLSSYRYLKISLDDRKTLPINILKIGRYKNTTQSDSLLEIAPESYQTTELLSQKISRIHVIFNPLQIVNQVSFTITNPNLFKRKARIYVMKSEEIKHKKKTFEETIVRFELNSETKNSFKIPQLFQKDFYIEIENRDNPPLTLAGIHFFQQQLAVIAYLNANENYTLKTGNPKWLTPEYDLENFKNTIPDHLAQVKITEIEHQEINKKNPENKSIWQQAWFMWLCIGIGGLAIVYFTLSLVKDMNKN